jgi:hypothetical protein
MNDTLDKLETRKDTIQVAVESGATHVGGIVGIVVGAVRDITHEVGEWATDMFEIRDAARRARKDADSRSEPSGPRDTDAGTDTGSAPRDAPAKPRDDEARPKPRDPRP